MDRSKRRHENHSDQPQKKVKINNRNNDNLFPSLAELHDDILDHIITKFLGVSSLLTLAMTCSKLNNLVSSQYKRIMRRIFPCRMDTTEEVRDQIQSELKNIAKIEKAFNNKVRVIEVDDDPQRNVPPIFKSFPGDPNKLMCVTAGADNSLVQIVDMEQGNIYAVSINFSIQDVAMSSDQKVAFLGRDGRVQIHSVKNPANWTKVCAFKTELLRANIVWMSSTGHWLIYHKTVGNYQIVNEMGETIKEVQYQDNKWRLFAISDDGCDAVLLLYRPYKCGTLSRVDLLTNEATWLSDTEDAADDFCNFKFLTGTDWVAWQRMGTEKFALFMYNLKTGERYWTPTSCGPRLSYGGTMVCHTGDKFKVLKVHDLYSDERFEIGPFDNCRLHSAEWTHLLDEDGNVNERIVATLSTINRAIGIIDPSSGKLLAEVYNAGYDVQWKLYCLLANGRTLVFHDQYDRHGLYFMVWNLY